ncbi:hypothetical protein [Nocardia asiatica]|uniref:hypothetical protein n=1 Tax=Nocardia asiatica TaxID=209252 RepID=UPI0002ED2836|nr:hypothetical protein [Nocardia asiatica]
MRARPALLLACSIALVVAVVTVLVIGRHDSSTDTSPAPITVEAAPTSADPPTGSGFADPTSDRYGRKVAIPNNPAGQPLPQREPAPGRIECGPGGAVTSPEQVMIQHSYGMPVLVSPTDGPTRLERTVLTGYRHSPQGAVLAGWNWISRSYVGGAPARDTFTALTMLSADDRDRIAQAPLAMPSNAEKFRAAVVAPDAFRVLSCDAEFVAAEWALRLEVDDSGTPTTTPRWIGMRLNLLWREGTWKVQPSKETSLGSGHRYNSLEGWTRWTL